MSSAHVQTDGFFDDNDMPLVMYSGNCEFFETVVEIFFCVNWIWPPLDYSALVSSPNV